MRIPHDHWVFLTRKTQIYTKLSLKSKYYRNNPPTYLWIFYVSQMWPICQEKIAFTVRNCFSYMFSVVTPHFCSHMQIRRANSYHQWLRANAWRKWKATSLNLRPAQLVRQPNESNIHAVRVPSQKLAVCFQRKQAQFFLFGWSPCRYSIQVKIFLSGVIQSVAPIQK